jgi:hypothetical protein
MTTFNPSWIRKGQPCGCIARKESPLAPANTVPRLTRRRFLFQFQIIIHANRKIILHRGIDCVPE